MEETAEKLFVTTLLIIKITGVILQSKQDSIMKWCNAFINLTF